MAVQEYPTCIKSCLEDDNCVSCNYDLVSQQCELSNGTKALFPDEFVNKNYSIYTEILWQAFAWRLFVDIKRLLYQLHSTE